MFARHEDNTFKEPHRTHHNQKMAKYRASSIVGEKVDATEIQVN